jgi:hypothetical protein
MRKPCKRGRTDHGSSIEEEIAHLRDLDFQDLSIGWRRSAVP